MKVRSGSTIILHPWIAGIYPILALLAFNIDQIPISYAYRPIVVSIVGAGLMWLTFQFLVKDVNKSAILTTLTLVLFYTYGHFYASELIPAGLGEIFSKHRNLVFLFALIWGGTIFFVIRKSFQPAPISATLNIVGTILLGFSIFQIGIYKARVANQDNPALDRAIVLNSDFLGGGSQLPDIYYIILDMYTRADFLTDQMNYDNDPFLQQLENNGFYVADCSLSNYSITAFSLSSSLNLYYLDALVPNLDTDSKDHALMDPLIHNNLVRRSLENIGYTIVAFQTDFPTTELRDADYFISFEQINKFESLLIQTTAARILPEVYSLFKGQTNSDPDYLARQRQFELTNNVLNAAMTVPIQIEGPKFVFLHIVSPHPPFVFKADGSFRQVIDIEDDPEIWKEYYVEQLTYINRRIFELITKILTNSQVPPIVIVQGDHGIPVFERKYFQHNEILDAYYFPNGGDEVLYPTVSPVNSFRLMFNYYFGTELDLLDDRAFTSQWLDAPYQFEAVGEQYPGCFEK